MYHFPQLQVLLDHPPEDPKKYLHAGISEEEARNLTLDLKTGLPLFLPNHPEAAQELKTTLDKELPIAEMQEDNLELPLDHQIERSLDLLLNIRDTILSRLQIPTHQ